MERAQRSLEFFHTREMPTKVEAELRRVFPLSNTAQSVWDTLVGYLKESNGVTIISNARRCEASPRI